MKLALLVLGTGSFPVRHSYPLYPEPLPDSWELGQYVLKGCSYVLGSWGQYILKECSHVLGSWGNKS